ncbi:lymphocyte-specific helicase-like [Leptopilina heterotoma]|uniref:lymphocyte-specific helicase-like n=1 Tax=Leptopilina heterotoma TaxID=63436 RepID=UPI001CA8CB37|nr:lymphocyte-specific helicase-like [Leptopilina heterotoma]
MENLPDESSGDDGFSQPSTSSDSKLTGLANKEARQAEMLMKLQLKAERKEERLQRKAEKEQMKLQQQAEREEKRLQLQAEREEKMLQHQAEMEEKKLQKKAEMEEKRLKHQAEVDERKQQRQLDSEEKHRSIDTYDKQLQEKRYKSLMHLVNQSKFFSNIIMDKYNESPEKKSTTSTNTRKRRSRRGKLNDSQENDESLSPSKKRKMTENKKVLREIVNNKIKKKKKNNANLSSEEIAEALLESDDEDEDKMEVVEDKKKFVHPEYFIGNLHDYQKDGLKWLIHLNKKGLNGILADEMGLGKTIQIIALICHLVEVNQPGPYLIVVPLSTVPNWIMEFERFAPEIPVVLFYGDQEKRSQLYKDIRKEHKIGSCKTKPVVITSFEMPHMERKFLSTYSWRYIIVDEGQRIKNHECLLVETLKKIKSLNRTILTGTPLQNNLSELWSLLNFLQPDLFDDLDVFESWFDVKELETKDGTAKFLKQEEEKNIVGSLREILKPFMLRRIKTEVNLNIPQKKEIIVYAPISELQRDLYKAVLTRDIQRTIEANQEYAPKVFDGVRPKRRCTFLNSYNERELADTLKTNDLKVSGVSENNDVTNFGNNYILNQSLLKEWKDYTAITENNAEYLVRMKFGNRATIYKQIVNHPYLVYYPIDYTVRSKPDDSIIKVSGKLSLLDKLLEKLKERGHKVLLFSTMTTILDTIEDYLTLRENYLYVRLDGGCKVDDRTVSIKRFNQDPNVFLFLLSTRAGGVGLNLTAADTVIIYDCDWNPQADIQAMSRCHRIGQTKPVVIYKLCTRGTIDEAIIKRGEAKRKLERMVISDNIGLQLNNKESLMKLKELLESSDNLMISENIIDDEELNKILDRSDMC